MQEEAAAPLKLLMVPCSEEEVADCVRISNLLSGIEFKLLDLAHHRFSRLRIQEFTWNNLDIELWCLYGASDYQDALPDITMMDACGLILVSTSPPLEFLQRNNAFFYSMDFPILWITNEQLRKASATHLESSIQALNVTKVAVEAVDEDSLITSEFNHWLIKVNAYLSRNRR